MLDLVTLKLQQLHLKLHLELEPKEKFCATSVVSNGVVESITVTNPGVGYTRVPHVLIEPPKVVSEKVDVEAYYGDNGDIVGMALTTLSANEAFFLFDFYIPVENLLLSEMRRLLEHPQHQLVEFQLVTSLF